MDKSKSGGMNAKTVRQAGHLTSRQCSVASIVILGTSHAKASHLFVKYAPPVEYLIKIALSVLSVYLAFSMNASDTCLPCPRGESSAPGSSACYSCKPGEEFSPDGFTCRPCPVGHARSHTQVNCSRCTKGQIASSEGAAYCKPCPAGFYSASSHECKICPSGTYCSIGTHTPENCTAPSSFCKAGSATPNITRAGYYTNERRTNISLCEPGYYCLHGVKRPCPKNTYGSDPGLTSSTCSGMCSSDLYQRSNMSATICECMESFVTINQTSNSVQCTCAPEMYLAGQRCVPCPRGFSKPLNGTDKCEPREISVVPIIVTTCTLMLLCFLAVIFVAWKRSKNAAGALKVITNALMLTLAALFMELLDLATDYVTCRNILNSNETFFAEYRTYYVAFLMSSLAGCIFAVYVRLRALPFFWEHHRYITTQRSGKRMSIVRDHMQRVIPAIDEKLAATETIENLNRSLKVLIHHKRSTYAQAAVFLLEDVPMGSVNFVVFTRLVYDPVLMCAVCSTDPHKIIMMVVAVLLSGINGTWKWSKIKDLPNVWNRISIVEKEIARREKTAHKNNSN